MGFGVHSTEVPVGVGHPSRGLAPCPSSHPRGFGFFVCFSSPMT